MVVASDRGITRILEKLEASVNSGKYYEAHQMYRTLYFRLLGQNKYKELSDMLEKGSQMMLEHQQQESGADLAILFVDVLVKSKSEITEETISRVTNLFSLMSPTIPERDTYLTSATRWSMGSNSIGHATFHHKIAHIYWNQKNYASARQHFLHTSDSKSYANMLIEFHAAKGPEADMDMSIAPAVFQLLCLKKVPVAKETFVWYAKLHPAINKHEPPYPTPLLNLLWILITSIEKNQVDIYNDLLVSYSPSIQRDPSFATYMTKLGHMFFGTEPPTRNRLTGLYDNIIQSLLNDSEELSPEDEPMRPVEDSIHTLELD